MNSLLIISFFCVKLITINLFAIDFEGVYFQDETKPCDSVLITLFSQENKYEGIYYLKKPRQIDGFIYYSFNENNAIVIVSNIGSFNFISEYIYSIAGNNTVTDKKSLLIMPSKLKKANKKKIVKIEKRIGIYLSSQGYCIHKNFILRCNE